ncbi:BON domain-containing protein [Candidatus Methylocalor cossyra]|uniref:BON domain-containing protein n=1 Tax=Candidatus Methylocalor cossyra TaxID=3108543 RepID=A0ABP1C5Y8_9GAMM
MNRGTTVAGAVLGAALMYLFDPDRGRQRRALLRDKAASGLNSVRAAAAVTQRDLWNRASGLIAELWAQLTSGPVPDDVLLRRIRSHLGRVVSHPRLIEVSVHNGRAVLSGPVLAHEHLPLYRCVRSVRGVTGVEDRLEVHEAAENFPVLRGGVPRRWVKPDILQEQWAPATRLIVGTTGGTLALNALRQRTPLQVLLGLVGSALCVEALSRGTPRRRPGPSR